MANTLASNFTGMTISQLTAYYQSQGKTAAQIGTILQGFSGITPPVRQATAIPGSPTDTTYGL